MKTIDSIQPPVQHSRPKNPKVRPPQSRLTGARFTAFTKTPRRRRAWGVILAVALSPVLFALVLAGETGIGVVLAYGVVVLVRRWPSRVSYTLALTALIYMVILQMAAVADQAQAMAVLAYFLLAIGTISLAIEIKMSSRVWFKKH